MNKKLIVGLVVLAVSALFPLSSLSSSQAKTDQVVLSEDNLIVLNSQVDGESTSAVIMKARELCNAGSASRFVKGTKRLKLFLNSPGGSIQSGLEMIEALKGLGCPVDTITLFAASMAFQIAQNLDDRLIMSNGVLMSHHARGEIQGDFGGVSTQMDSRYKLWLDRIRELDEQTVRRTKGKQTYESYTKEYDHEVWLTGNRSVNEGYADKIVNVRCDSSLKGVTTHTVQFFGIPISYDLDNCPLNTAPMNIRIEMPPGQKMNEEVVNEIKAKFLTQFTTKQKQVVPMYW